MVRRWSVPGWRGVARLAVLGVLAIASSPAASRAAGSRQPAVPSPTALASLIARTQTPVNDAVALYARLVLHRPVPVLPDVPATDYPLGYQQSFYISDDTAASYTLHSAHLLAKTAHAYYYVEDGRPVDRAGLQAAANLFEHAIYPADRAAFGVERDPAHDREPHVTVYLGTTPGVGGYFSPVDLLPRSIYRYSNQHRMIYIAFGSGSPNSASYLLTLAHEFQHMIHYQHHPAQDVWINEGASMLAQELTGYGVEGDDAKFASAGPVQLDSWDAPVGSIARYGAAYLWLLYLYEHKGGIALPPHAAGRPLADRYALFDDRWRGLATMKIADAVFGDWVVANYLNDRHLDGGRYGYQHSTVHATVTATHALPMTRSAAMPPYAASYIDLTGTHGKPFTLRFTGQPTVPLLGTKPPAPTLWWSNRADNVDTTLTSPALDLRGLQHATLRYQAWYDLEQTFDYAYVEASIDGGTTWHTLRTQHTSNVNPNGANLGNGLTGSSCSRASKAHACWVAEQADLTPYAGHHVLLRWEQVTDAGYNGQGLAITQIQVPEAGITLDIGAAGWQSAGWIAAGNTLAARWLVTALVYSPGGVRVVQVPVGADGRGSLSVPAGTSHVVVCVSPLAAKTTVQARYTLSAG